MTLTRRDAALLAAAAVLAPPMARAEAAPAAIFAEPGAAAPSPASLGEAIGKGADFLVVGVIASRDGALLAGPDNALGAFTDIAARPEFADRRKDATVDGVAASGWFSEDFTVAELRTLVTGPAPRNGPHAAPPTLMTLEEVIAVARAGCVREGRVIGVSPRLVHPSHFAARSLNLEPRLADVIRLQGYDWPSAAMIVQSSEPASLQALAGLTRVRRIQLIDAGGGPVDPAAPRFLVMIEPDGLSAVKAWAGAIGPAESLVIQPGPKGAVAATPVIAAAHAAGLQVFARAEPPRPHEGYNGPRARMTALFLAGADGVMAADVGLAAHARRDAAERRSPEG